MGAQVYIKDVGVYLYTDTGAVRLIEDVKQAIAKRWKWDDPECLARIIFDEMIGKAQGGKLGFGITSKGVHPSSWRIIEIDCEKQNIKVIDYGNIKLDVSFDDFIWEDVSD